MIIIILVIIKKNFNVNRKIKTKMNSNFLKRFGVKSGKNSVNKNNKKEKYSKEVEQLLSSSTKKQKLF